MLGGVTLNGPELFSAALSDQQRIEEEIRSIQPPVHFEFG